MKWSPRSVCDLYRRRWDIEVFFKQVKQSLKLGSFLGHRANAVRWQVYTALLVYVLLRFKAQGSSCPVCGTAVIFLVKLRRDLHKQNRSRGIPRI
jgi:IS4 transposase